MPNKEKEHIGTALARAQLNITTAPCSGINPHFGSTYAMLKDFIRSCRNALNKEGIAIHFESGYTPERTEANMNEAGEVTGKTHFPRQDFLALKLVLEDQALTSTIALVCSKDDMQSRKSAQTYGMRSLLESALCIDSEELDDDGNRAVGEEKMSAKTSKRSNYKKEAAKSQGEAVEKQADGLFVKP
tara:strand:- start:120 stop:680 length:561 start_codon:yes stop_codon:yes gene_type:complete